METRRFFPMLVLALLLAGCGGETTADVPVADADHSGHEMSGEPAAEDHSGHEMAAEDHSGHEMETGQSSVAPGQLAQSGAIDTGRTLYTCGMHPNVIQDEPGNCPICGMRLTPLNPLSGGGGVVEIDPGTIQTIGVRTAEVVVRELQRTVRTTGRFEMDEQGAHTVTLKIGGWVERLYVDFDGAVVRKGQALLELYSPELVATQEEYLLALAGAKRLQQSGDEQAAADAQRLVDAARRRLAFYDLDEGVIDEVAQTGEPRRTIRFMVPASGEVMQHTVSEGQRVEAGQPLMEIFDTSRIWLVADVFEQDLPWVQVGTPASVTVPYVPDRVFQGRVDYIYYMLDRESRSARARITLPRAGSELRPGMYAVVSLSGQPSRPLPAVPEEAVLWTGEQSFVILAIGSGRFRPVPVVVGTQADGVVQVIEGLSGGETVVTSAQFLIDSEARLNSAVGAMVGTHQHED